MGSLVGLESGTGNRT